MRRTALALALTLAAGLASGQAHAQWLDTLFPSGVPGYGNEPGVTVTSRRHPEAEPLGIHIGDVTLQPTWEQSLGYDDNVLGAASRQGSWVIETHPSLLLRTDGSRGTLGGWLSADDRRDPGAPAQSRTDWTGSLGGSADVGRDRLTLAASYMAQHQDRTALDALPTDSPVPYRIADARLSYAWTAGRWTATPGLEIASWRFGMASILGAPASQAYRDHLLQQASLTIAYELAPRRNLVLVTRALSQHYPNQSGLNSTGFQALAGLDYDDDALWRYRLLLGGEQRDFAATSFASRTAAIAEAQVTWFPTGMTTVAATFARSMEDAAQEGVAGFTYTNGRLTLDHELRRDVLLHVSIGSQRADFLQGGAPQSGWSLGTGATWYLRRQVHISATYDLTTLHGGHAPSVPLSNDYTRNLVLIMLRLGL